MTRAAGCDAPGSSLLGDFYVTRGCETGEIFTAKRVIRGKSVVVPRESWRQRMEVYDPRCLTRANAPRPRLDARARRLFLVPFRPSCSRFIRVQLSVNDAFSPVPSIQHRWKHFARRSCENTNLFHVGRSIFPIFGEEGELRWSQVFSPFFFSPSESEIKISGNIFRNCERRLKKMVSNFFFRGNRNGEIFRIGRVKLRSKLMTFLILRSEF